MTQDDSPASPSDSVTDYPVPFAWQPITPRGVAAFAHSTLRRLLLIELLVAALAAGTVVWFLSTAWFPAISQAVRQLPSEGTIRGQILDLPITFAQTLSERPPFLLLVLDLERQRNASQTSDVLVEFHKNNFQICSLLGCLLFNYPKSWNVEFSGAKLVPLWDAWEPILLVLAAISVFFLLFVSWTFLATLYCMVVRLLGFFKDRDLNWRSSWLLASATLMPGALLLVVGAVCYGLRFVDLIRLLLLFPLHLVVGWVYLAVSPLFVSRLRSVSPPGSNPFAPSPPTQ
jgi:hypothetical protein